MANSIFEKDHKILYNSVPDQRLTYANQLTVKNWNDIINILKVQANINADYLEKLHTWFIGNYDPTKSFEDNIISIPVDEVVFNESTSFAEYVLGEIDYLIKNPVLVKKEAIVETLDPGTLSNLTQATVKVTGNGRREYPGTNNKPLEFEFKIPRGMNGYGVHFFSIEDGDLVMYRERHELIGEDHYGIDPTTGELYISFEKEE